MQARPAYSGFVAITAGGPIAWTQINALRDALGPFPVILVPPADAPATAKTGLFAALARMVGGQSRTARARQIDETIESFGLQIKSSPDQYEMRLPTANNLRCQDALRTMGPDAVFVIDAGSICPETVACVDAPFIEYRASLDGGAGVSLCVLGDGEHSEEIVAQLPVPIGKSAGADMSPWLIAAHARPVVLQTVREALSGGLRTQFAEPPPPAAAASGGYLGAPA